MEPTTIPAPVAEDWPCRQRTGALQVYVGSEGADGERFMYEAHAPFPSDEEADGS